MKGYALHNINDFRYEEISKPDLYKGTVLVSVKAAGICGSDIPRVFRTGTYSYPLVLGHEFAGVVKETGDGVDESWIGKRVGVFPLIPCNNCTSCQNKKYEMCEKYSYLGSRTDGGFAEYVRVPVWNLIELPDSVSMEQAAMMEPMAVAVHAIRRAKVCISDTIVVCGLGTIGLFVIMFLKEMGCQNIFCIGTKELQKKLAEQFGISASHYCDGTKENVAKWILDNSKGADVFFECVGKNETLTQALECASSGGKVQIIGNPMGDMELKKEVYWKILRKQLTVLGTWNSSYTHEKTDDWHYVLERLENGRIEPEKMITHKFLLEQLQEGFDLMHDKNEDYVKVMVSGKKSL